MSRSSWEKFSPVRLCSYRSTCNTGCCTCASCASRRRARTTALCVCIICGVFYACKCMFVRLIHTDTGPDTHAHLWSMYVCMQACWIQLSLHIYLSRSEESLFWATTFLHHHHSHRHHSHCADAGQQNKVALNNWLYARDTARKMDRFSGGNFLCMALEPICKHALNTHGSRKFWHKCVTQFVDAGVGYLLASADCTWAFRSSSISDSATIRSYSKLNASFSRRLSKA